MCLRMIPWWCMARRSIRTHPFTIRRRDTTPLAWRFPLASASIWERLGEEAGVGEQAGETTKSTLITTITSIVTRTSTAAIETISTAGTATTSEAEIAAETAAGSTIHNIAAAPLMGTEAQQTGSAARHVETRCRIARLTPGNRSGDRAAISPAIGAAMVVSAIGVAMAASAIGLA